nr:hypothetical protein [Bacillus velezensis]
MDKLKFSLHEKGAHTLKRTVNGGWILDSKQITQDQAINELAEAVSDLGY